MKHAISILLLLALSACGSNLYDGVDDNDTPEAIQSRIIKDLDEGRFQAVLDNPHANAIDYSTAAMGLAGLNTTRLIKAINRMADASQAGDIGPITALSLDSTVLDVRSNLGTDILDESRSRLLALLARNPGDPTASFQLVMLAVVDIATHFAKGVDTLVAAGDALDGIDTTEAGALATEIQTSTNSFVDTLVTRVDRDVKDLNNHLADAGLGNGSIRASLRDTIREVAGIPAGTDLDTYLQNNNISRTEVADYLSQILGN